MTTTAELAAQLGCHLRTVQRAAAKTGIPKRGRDYLFTDEQVEFVSKTIRGSRPGRPKPRYDTGWVSVGDWDRAKGPEITARLDENGHLSEK